MKKIFTVLILTLFSITGLRLSDSTISAKKYPEIKFNKTHLDLGTFSQDDPVQECSFTFTNVGKAKLTIVYIQKSCGCTTAEYPHDPISPGATGTIKVTYDGTGKMPGHFKKYLSIYTNCKDDYARVSFEGFMSEMSVEDVKKLKVNESEKKPHTEAKVKK